MRAGVGDAGDEQRARVVLEDDVLVQQHRHPAPAELEDPCLRAGVVLVIAGDEERAMARRELRQRRDVPRQLAHIAVDEVAGHRDHVGLEAVDRLDDVADVTALDRRPDVDVRDLRDREAMKRLGKPRDRHVDLDDRGRPPRIPDADQRDRERHHRNGDRRRVDDTRPRQRIRQQPHGDRDRQQQRVAQQRQHEQRREAQPSGIAIADSASRSPSADIAAGHWASAGSSRRPMYAWSAADSANGEIRCIELPMWRPPGRFQAAMCMPAHRQDGLKAVTSTCFPGVAANDPIDDDWRSRDRSGLCAGCCALSSGSRSEGQAACFSQGCPQARTASAQRRGGQDTSARPV